MIHYINNFFKRISLYLFLFTLLSCAHEPNNIDNRLKNLHNRLEWVYFDLSVENCFRKLHICELKDEKSCWAKHEKCVLFSHDRWKKLTK